VSRPTVLVLAGGPDAEREVSLAGGTAIAAALERSGKWSAHLAPVDRLTLEELRGLPGDVIFPVLHGPFGEGGGLQRVLEADGRPYVGSRAVASRIAIDKVLTKSVAGSLGMDVLPTALLDPADDTLAMALPVVVKPVFEGSTIGLHICAAHEAWEAAHRASAALGKPCMIEPAVQGREVTVGLLDSGRGLEPLPIIEIEPAEGLYDYEAKYTRNDTRYVIEPAIPEQVAATMREKTLALAAAIGVRHLCRADFILDEDNRPWFLEINTMPGFTDHSLVPMAAAHIGIDLAALTARLATLAEAEGDAHEQEVQDQEELSQH
jgi:D-alanine-D-alanine ligase